MSSDEKDLENNENKSENLFRLLDVRVTDEELNQSPGLCHKAHRFCSIVFFCCLIGLWIPIAGVCLGVLGDFDEDVEVLIFGITIASFLLGLMFCCWGLLPIYVGGIFCKPKGPDPLNPFKKAEEGERKTYKVEVKKLYVIVNPHGGGGRALRLLENHVLPVWKELGLTVTVLKTEFAGHAVKYAQTLDFEGYDALCIIGGDGSFHELVNGLLTRPDGKLIPLGLLPGGSGNSIVTDFHCNNDLEKAARRIAKGYVTYMDANKVDFGNGKSVYNVNVLGVGLVGDIGILSEKYRFIGRMRYDLFGVWTALLHNSIHVKVTIDDSEVMEANALTAMIGHTQYSGNGARCVPTAQVDDGKLDVLFFEKARRGDLIRLSMLLPDGSHLDDPYIQIKQGKKAAFELEPGLVNVDGELYPHTGKFVVTVVHKAFPYLSPPNIIENGEICPEDQY